MPAHLLLLAGALASAPALAAPAIAEVERVLKARGGAPELVVACSPVAPVVRFAGMVPIPPEVLGEAASSANGRWWMDLLRPGAAEAAGFDLQGPLVLSSWTGKNDRFELPFTGTEAQAEAATRHLLPPKIEVYGQDWSQKAAAEWAASRTDTRLYLDRGDTGGRVGGVPNRALVSGYPEAPSCVIFAAPPKDLGDKVKVAGVSLFLPLERGHAFLGRVQTEAPAPVVLEKTVGAPVTGHGARSPMAVLVLGVSLLDLAQNPMFGEKTLSAHEVAQIRQKLQLPPGATLALHSRPPQGDFTAVIPVRSAAGKPVKGSKLVEVIGRLAEDQGVPFTRTGKTTFVLELEKRRLYGHAVERGVILGSHPGFAAEAAEEAGTPWVDPQFHGFLAEWPVALVGSLPSNAGRPPTDLQAGLRTRDGIWELSFRATMPEMNDEATALLLGMMSAIAVPNFLEMQRRTHRAEVPGQIDRILAAQELWKAEHGSYLALPAAPRAIEGVNKAAVAWTAGGEWERLGAAPDGEVRGVYWVEVAADGAMTVHGVCDIDGDGVPAHYSRSPGEVEVQRRTDPKVY